MCGIAGILRYDGDSANETELLAARERMFHRGPDDSGLYTAGPIGLAHRRLSIIDLSPAGRMPMANETGDVWAVFNGEIYNFVSLRIQLEAKGHTFRSHTDSEVIIHAFEEWGFECFRRFEGMFAIAIWDARTKRLVLARDIAGEKPLFYAQRENKLGAFASTLSALLQFRDLSFDVDADSLRDYIELGFVPAPRSIVKGVTKLAPGCYVVLQAGKAATQIPYWSLEEVAGAGERAIRVDDATDELHELLRSAVRARLVADVPLGAFLSGGVDSSLVVALMAEASSDVRTYTIAFEEKEYDESPYAARIAQHLGVTNTKMVLSASDVLRELPAITAAFDEPMADYSALPSLAVARLARAHVTVALTGDGADEAFAGYRYYSGVRVFERIAGVVPSWLRDQVSQRSSAIPWPRLRRAVRRSSATDAAAYFARCGFYRGSTADDGVQRALLAERRAVSDIASYVRAHDDMSATAAGLLWDATHTLPDAWLTKVDRTSMAVSLEARAPFLDRRVLEHAFTLPLRARVTYRERKVVLRRILARYLPWDLINRPKQGFTAPMRTWFANELRSELHERLAAPRIERYGILNSQGVQELLAEQGARVADHTQLLWALFHLDRWYEANSK
jgi:asparagine synthase (glutamine-hydrolysing)